MKAWLIFNLPEDQEAYERANNADDLCSFISDFESYLRGQWKWAEKPDDIDAIYDKWFEMKSNKGIDMDRLWG